jgi:dihydroorotate dehydrogenase
MEIVKKRLLKRDKNKNIIGINLGKNKNSEIDSNEDYLIGLKEFQEYGDYFVINISSPNTPLLRDYHNEEKLTRLLNEIKSIKFKKPILIKLSPDLNDESVKMICEISVNKGIDGLIVSNTTLGRPDTFLSQNKNEIGGLSGRLIYSNSNILLKKVFQLTNGKIPIIGVGGITNGQEAYEKIKLGATLVQIYTSLIYQGPEIIPKIKRELIECLEKDKIKNIKEAIGKGNQ